MLPLKKIVCPTDFSEPAHEGLKIARELATQFSSEILLVHVVTPLPAMHGGAAPTGFHIPAVLKELEGSAKSSLEEPCATLGGQRRPGVTRICRTRTGAQVRFARSLSRRLPPCGNPSRDHTQQD